MYRKGYFEGYYFKHQKCGETVALIPGISEDSAFIQVITNKRTLNLQYPTVSIDDAVRIGNSIFSRKGIEVNEEHIKGKIIYRNVTPLSSDIMGPFRFLPMECRHSIISMYHNLSGGIDICGEYYDFDEGIGYIEADRGRSFPKKYLWLQCNDFTEKCSLMVAIADIPFAFTHFTGCICAIIYKDNEYRLATYNGAKVAHMDTNCISLKRDNIQLDINIGNKNALPLAAPVNGIMKGVIHESNSSAARFLLREGTSTVFDLYSENVSFEYNWV